MSVIFSLYDFSVIQNLLIFVIDIIFLRITIQLFNGRPISFIEDFFLFKIHLFIIHTNKNRLCYLIIKRTTEILK